MQTGTLEYPICENIWTKVLALYVKNKSFAQKRFTKYYLCFFVYSLFNDAINNSNYIASNEGMGVIINLEMTWKVADMA